MRNEFLYNLNLLLLLFFMMAFAYCGACLFRRIRAKAYNEAVTWEKIFKRGLIAMIFFLVLFLLTFKWSYYEGL